MKERLKICFLLLLVCAMLVGTLPVTAQDVAEGFRFDHLSSYNSVEKEIPLPATFEANVYLPENYSARAGVIIGNYSGGKGPEVNFEVYTNGKPRVCINNVDGVSYDVVFDKVDIRLGKPVHLAITIDHDNARWSCYVDGALAQIIAREAPAPFKFKTRLGLGGDLRAGNKQYFKGSIFDVALYSNVRGSKKIAADYEGGTLDTNNIICAYDLSDIPASSNPTKIDCLVDSGLSVFYRTDWILDLEEPKDYAYSLAVIGDIQNLTNSYPDRLSGLYEWIRDNAETKRIEYVIGLGDITHTNSVAEYKRVVKAYDLIDGVVPFSIIRGNHDREELSSDKFDRFVTVEKYGDEITGSFDDTMKNTYRILKIGRVKYLFMNLDYLLKDEVLDWANEVISAHPECHVIVSTHIYFSASGKFYEISEKSTLRANYGCENNGEGLWEKVLSKHENVVMLLCGHAPTDNIYLRRRTGDNGNEVTEMLIDPQNTDLSHNGVGLVAMFYFSEDGSELEVQYYSTANDAFFKKNNQFKLTLDVPVSEYIPETEPEETEPEETEPTVSESLAPDTATSEPEADEPDTEAITPEASSCGSTVNVTVALVGVLALTLAANLCIIKRKKQ